MKVFTRDNARWLFHFKLFCNDILRWYCNPEELQMFVYGFTSYTNIIRCLIQEIVVMIARHLWHIISKGGYTTDGVWPLASLTHGKPQRKPGITSSCALFNHISLDYTPSPHNNCLACSKSSNCCLLFCHLDTGVACGPIATDWMGLKVSM